MYLSLIFMFFVLQSFNVLDYDEKVVDGFYDVYGVVSDFGTVEKIPSLVDLQSTPVTGMLGYEVVLVNRAVDPDLMHLEQASLCLAVNCGMNGISPQSSVLVQKIADLVVQHMGGPVVDANNMLRNWVKKSYELRTSINNIVLPLGCLKIGLSRHRALLFKVYRLVKSTTIQHLPTIKIGLPNTYKPFHKSSLLLFEINFYILPWAI
jgi:sterile alpha motif and leucine zipper-containing kinase AZK